MKKIIIPDIIDAHVHFRYPGAEHKEDWFQASKASKNGGITHILDMPNNSPSAINLEIIEQKDQRAKKESFVNYSFQLGATNDNLEEIKKANQDKRISAIKVYFGSSTGDLLVNNEKVIENILKTSEKIVTFHAEDEDIIQKNIQKYKARSDPLVHSLIRNPDSAISAVDKIIKIAMGIKKPIYICHISTKDELELIKKARQKGLTVYAEVCIHHLFLDESYYQKLGNFVKVNPPIRSRGDVQFLWQALNDGIIDILATDHAPHTIAEKKKNYWEAPAGIPGEDTFLPLLLDAVNRGMLTIDQLTKLISENPKKIFKIYNKNCYTEIDLEKTKKITKDLIFSKCNWSPYEGRVLKGWPKKTCINLANNTF